MCEGVHGVFDCPDDDCDETIIGTYGDLIDHVYDEHPLLRVVCVDGENYIDRIEAARKQAMEGSAHA